MCLIALLAPCYTFTSTWEQKPYLSYLSLMSCLVPSIWESFGAWWLELPVREHSLHAKLFQHRVPFRPLSNMAYFALWSFSCSPWRKKVIENELSQPSTNKLLVQPQLDWAKSVTITRREETTCLLGTDCSPRTERCFHLDFYWCLHNIYYVFFIKQKKM